jgi:hypothetical protein
LSELVCITLQPIIEYFGLCCSGDALKQTLNLPLVRICGRFGLA